MILLIAQSLSTAGPGELTRLLRLLDVDGRTRQIRVPAHMVMSVDEEVPERTRPDVVGLLCTPVAQRFDSAWNRINEIYQSRTRWTATSGTVRTAINWCLRLRPSTAISLSPRGRRWPL